MSGGGGWLSGGRGPSGPCNTPNRGPFGFMPLEMISLILDTAAVGDKKVKRCNTKQTCLIEYNIVLVTVKCLCKCSFVLDSRLTKLFSAQVYLGG